MLPVLRALVALLLACTLTAAVDAAPVRAEAPAAPVPARAPLAEHPRQAPSLFEIVNTVTREANGLVKLVFDVILRNPPKNGASVSFKTENGTAKAGQDYVKKEGRLTFKPGDTKKQIVVQVKGDRKVEPKETLRVKLFDSSGPKISDGVAKGTILPDDGELTVEVRASGAGTISIVPEVPYKAYTCTTKCSRTYPLGTKVTLTQKPAAGKTFTGWSGPGCSGTGSCTVKVGKKGDMTGLVVAKYQQKTYALKVTKAGNGSGTVQSQGVPGEQMGSGIVCGDVCTKSYAHGTAVTLVATPATGATFTGWSGACTGTGSCVVTMNAKKDVTATFTVPVRTLDVARAGNGSGTVTSTPAGISCGNDCTEDYAQGTSVTLTATPANGSTFTGWSGACTGAGTCTVAMTATASVTATFTLIEHGLTVSKDGNGTGTIASTPAGISCGNDCTEDYVQGTLVTLTATPANGSTFLGWSGPCSGVGTCTVAMTAATDVTATFTLVPHTLTVSRAGNGTGTVTSSPAGISCGNDCSEHYLHGTTITLTATPAGGSTFGGWTGGGCTGTGTCTVTLAQATMVTATFVNNPRTLTVNMTGAVAGGTITSNPVGIDCGVDCTQVYDGGTTVTLIANPLPGYLISWSGCDGPAFGTCTVTLDSDRTVTADVVAPGPEF